MRGKPQAGLPPPSSAGPRRDPQTRREGRIEPSAGFYNAPGPGGPPSVSGLARTHWPLRLPSTVFGWGVRGKRLSPSSPLSQTMLLPWQLRLPWTWFETISIASGSASWLLTYDALPPTSTRAVPSQHDVTFEMSRLPPTELSS